MRGNKVINGGTIYNRRSHIPNRVWDGFGIKNRFVVLLKDRKTDTPGTYVYDITDDIGELDSRYVS